PHGEDTRSSTRCRKAGQPQVWSRDIVPGERAFNDLVATISTRCRNDGGPRVRGDVERAFTLQVGVQESCRCHDKGVVFCTALESTRARQEYVTGNGRTVWLILKRKSKTSSVRSKRAVYGDASCGLAWTANSGLASTTDCALAWLSWPRCQKY
ncbi:hypothetical protein THAOC_30378, partial [Thalassiosira oceanica]